MKHKLALYTAVALPVASSAAFSVLRPSLADEVPVEFFATVAAIVPVFLLALAVELQGALSRGTQASVAGLYDRTSRVLSEARTTYAQASAADDLVLMASSAEDARAAEDVLAELTRLEEGVRTTALESRSLVRVVCLLSAIGEGAALYAIASQRSGTFLTVLCAQVVAVQIGVLSAMLERSVARKV